MNLDSEKKNSALKNLEQRATELEKQQDKFSDLYAVFQEERFTLHTPEERRVFNPAYFEKEAAAVAQLLKYAQQRIAEKKFEEALKFLDATLMSNLRVRQAQDMKIECLRALNKNSEADKLAKEALIAWPEMNLWRRLFRFLGMIASDGKAMIVGFLQKGGKKRK
jgi:predicted Zn-dependent protease